MKVRTFLTVLAVLGGSSLAAGQAPNDALLERASPATAEAQAIGPFARAYLTAVSRYLTPEELSGIGRASRGDDGALVYRTVDRALRVVVPLVLEEQGLAEAAATLRALPAVTGPDAAVRVHSQAMAAYPTIPFRRGHGLRVSAAESSLLAAMSGVRMLADDSAQRGPRALRLTAEDLRLELVANQAARAVGQALEVTANRAQVLEAAFNLPSAGEPTS